MGLIRLWDLWDPGNLDGTAWNGICQLCPNNPAKGVEILPSGVSLRVPEGYGINQHPPSGCTLPFNWGNPLSVVQKGRAEWWNDCQPSADNALAVRPGVQEVLLLPLGHIQGHLAPQPEKLPAISRTGPWWVISFHLTASPRLNGLTFQRRDLDWRSEGGSDIHPTATLLLPCPINMELKGGSSGRNTSCQADAGISLQSSCIMPRFQ